MPPKFRESRHEPLRNRFEVAACFCRRHAIFEPPDDFEKIMLLVVLPVSRREREWQPQISRFGNLEVGGQHADDGKAFAIDLNRLSGQIRIGSETTTP